MMRQWNLPDRLCTAIAGSHKLDNRRVLDPSDGFNRCVAISGGMVDIFLQASDRKPFHETAQQVERVFGLGKEDFGRVIQRVSSLVPETEAIYETEIIGDPDSIVEQAREVLMIRNLHTLQEMGTLRDTADSMSERARELEEESRRDPLTGAYNRAYLEQYLRQEFEQASRNDWPLSIAFCDLDGFKKVNDTYGHQAGDKVLVATADLLRQNVRRVDVVARYGGEEFVLVFPATDR
jgi:PleD family two-component response regulator